MFGGPPRKPESKLGQREMDLARSIQEVTEEVMLRLARTLHRETGVRQPLLGRRGCPQLRRERSNLAGGAASRDSGFSRQPAMLEERSVRHWPCGISLRANLVCRTGSRTR